MSGGWRLSPRFEDALIYATRLHAGQARKGSGIPYVSHLMAVSALTIEYGGGEDEAIAALLHDAVEDQGGEATRLEILDRYGERVTAIVDGCTDTAVFPKPPWRQRKEALHRARPHRPPRSAPGVGLRQTPQRAIPGDGLSRVGRIHLEPFSWRP